MHAAALLSVEPLNPEEALTMARGLSVNEQRAAAAASEAAGCPFLIALLLPRHPPRRPGEPSTGCSWIVFRRCRQPRASCSSWTPRGASDLASITYQPSSLLRPRFECILEAAGRGSALQRGGVG